MTQLLTELIRYSTLPPPMISSYDPKPIQLPWMQTFFGFTDTGPQANIFSNHTLTQDKAHDIGRLFNQPNQVYEIETGLLNLREVFQAGFFIYPTVREIREMVRSLNLRLGTPQVRIIAGKDIGAAHVEGTPYDVFQAASQLNALEMINPDITPFDGIENYINDNTQGPRAALACAAGTFVRNYWYTYTYLSQFNALERMGLSHQNGYLIWGTNPQEIAAKLNVEELMIPCMIYTQVVGITKRGGQVIAHAEDKLVHQVYSSGVPVNTYRNGGDNAIQLQIARAILRAEYIGAIGMALILHTLDKQAGKTTAPRPRIHLTLVGAGVFNVPFNIVIYAIQEAIREFSKYDCDIFIHGYTQQTADDLAAAFKTRIIPFSETLVQAQAPVLPTVISPPMIPRPTIPTTIVPTLTMPRPTVPLVVPTPTMPRPPVPMVVPTPTVPRPMFPTAVIRTPTVPRPTLTTTMIPIPTVPTLPTLPRVMIPMTPRK